MQCGDSCWHRGVSRTGASHSQRNLCRHCHGYGGTSNAHLLCTRLLRIEQQGLQGWTMRFFCCPAILSLLGFQLPLSVTTWQISCKTGNWLVPVVVGWNTFFGFGMEILRLLLGIMGSTKLIQLANARVMRLLLSHRMNPLCSKLRFWEFCLLCPDFGRKCRRKTCSQFTKMWSLGLSVLFGIVAFSQTSTELAFPQQY